MPLLTDGKNEVATVEERRPPSVLEIIAAAARDPEVDVAKLSALMDLQERHEARNAEMEFNKAFSAMQPMLPRIKKNGSINLGSGKPMSFAKWEDIDFVVRPILTDHGFTLSFTSEPTDKGVLMVAHLSHSLGHSRVSKMQLPPDTGPGRNALQAIGSTQSYGKRYLTAGILNLVFEGMDNDGNSAGFITQQQADSIRTLMAEIGMDKDPMATSKFLTLVNSKAVNEIHSAVYKTAITLLESKRRQAK